jgi:site-specific DNA-methyltransferase (adenine-specific)
LDALTFLSAVCDDAADIVFLDPPFNLGKDYGSMSRLELYDADAYDVYMRSVLNQTIRILKPGGALFLYHLPSWAIRWANHLSDRIEFRNWIAISMKNGFARGQRLYPAHYALLYYTKGAPARFTRPKLAPRRCRHCRRVLKDYGGYREIVERGGINLSDVWDDLSPVRHKSSKLRTPNQLPIEITDRVCAIAGGTRTLLIDPFVGTGTSLVSALHRKMRFIGNDIETSNLAISEKRLRDHATRAGAKQRRES